MGDTGVGQAPALYRESCQVCGNEITAAKVYITLICVSHFLWLHVTSSNPHINPVQGEVPFLSVSSTWES